MGSFIRHPLTPEFGRSRRLGLSLTDGYFWGLIAGGHLLYRSEANSEDIDYDLPVGFAAPAAVTVRNSDFVSHAVSSSYKYGLRAVGKCGAEEENTDQVSTVEFDANGDMVLPSPNSPYSLIVAPQSKTSTKLTWRYDPTGQQVAPGSFYIYADDVYSTSSSYRAGTRTFTVTVTHSYGVLHKFRVRARSAAGKEDANTIDRYGTYDSDAPPTPQQVYIEQGGS